MVKCCGLIQIITGILILLFNRVENLLLKVKTDQEVRGIRSFCCKIWLIKSFETYFAFSQLAGRSREPSLAAFGEDVNRRALKSSQAQSCYSVSKAKQALRKARLSCSCYSAEKQYILQSARFCPHRFCAYNKEVRQEHEQNLHHHHHWVIPRGITHLLKPLKFQVGFRFTSSFWVTFFFISSDTKSSKTKLQPNASASVLNFFSLTNSLA